MSELADEGLIDATETDPLAGFGLRRRRGVLVTTAAAVALGLSLGGGAVAGAAASTAPSSPSRSPSAGSRSPMGGSPPAAVGTVASVGDGTFTITTRDNTTVTVNVSSSTTYRDPAATSPTIANVTVGEHVAVFGSDASDVVTATSVAVGDPPGVPGGPRGTGGPRRPGGPANGTGKVVGPPPGGTAALSSSAA